jgi:hypothetical protein
MLLELATLQQVKYSTNIDVIPIRVGRNINCPPAVAAAAVLYVFRRLTPPHTPACTPDPVVRVCGQGMKVWCESWS